MDPISALSFASSIIAVIDLSTKVLSTSHEIYRSGSTQNHKEIAQIAQDFSDTNERLKLSIEQRHAASYMQDSNDKALGELAAASISISDELLRLLNRLRVDSKVRLWKSTLEAFLTVWKTDKIDALLERLDAIRAELTLRVVLTNKNSLDGLGVAFQQSFQLILSREDDACRILSDLVQRNVNADQDAGRRHVELLAAIRASTGQNVTNNTVLWQNAEKFDFPEDIQTHVLRSLIFPRMEDREEEIMVAHKKTFDWIFCVPEHHEKRWSNFTNWLHNGYGLYWINGKAASGKSTLMKFVKNDSRTHQALKVWAEPHQLLVSSFYFWNNGTSMQKSLEGLLRSILYDVLKARPELYSTIVTGNWRESVLREPVRSLPEPTLVQLQKAFRNLFNQRDADFKLCLIIDGLDEYNCAELRLPDLAELFKSVSTSKHMKIVVSSRPLLVFDEAFSQEPQLMLQDLTADDIKIYVDDKLGSHPRMSKFRLTNPVDAGKLASALVSKASGVFLWVRLVVESLLEGLTDGNGIDELHKTLDDLPEALEDLFRHMFRKIPQRYHLEASRIFQIVRQFQKTSDKYDFGGLTAARLSFAVEGSTALDTETQVGPLSLSQMSERYVDLERRLKSRCCGLIEIHNERNVLHQSGATLFQAEVQFIHKTVTDFLDDRAIWDTILTGSANDFDPNAALLNSYVMQFKRFDFGQDATTLGVGPRVAINAAAIFAKQVTNTSVQVALLHEMDSTMSLLWTRNRPKELYHWCNYINDIIHNKPCMPGEYHDSFLSFCIERGLRHYVAADFNEHGRELINKEGLPLLDYAIQPTHSRHHTENDPMIVTILLDNGANPNQVYNGWSAWSNALYYFHKDQRLSRGALPKVLELFVLHGADPNAVIEMHATDRERFKKRYSALRVLRSNIGRMDEEGFPILQNVIKLLIKRGAKEREWHDGKCVFPSRVSRSLIVPGWRLVRPGKAHSIDLHTSSENNLLRRMVLRVKNKRTGESEEQGV